ncbi:peptide deformylase [Ehrlichia minasensis]|uniref:Peptide deformylase n=1 Tax=Ehrlichia minasensis TaxID=1242993 RepID=A0A4Q6I975_9RICK|nr:peptide deformylase [Ehrlichia minasensis]RZB12567.1 peptide deformylase [Ehrlichia minasensis]CEI84869.1 Peptide deformylase (PDF) (Polypept ide deformylase) [Ehrlichia minasensis]
MNILSVDNAQDLRNLHAISHPIEKIDQEIIALANDMMKVMEHSKTVGLSAVQLGNHSRMFTINMFSGLFDVTQDIKVLSGHHSLHGKNMVCINPEVLSFSAETVDLFEGCSSAKSYGLINITRPRHMDFKYTDLLGNECVVRVYGWLSRCIQHELDHLNGILLANVVDNIKNNCVNSISHEDHSVIHILLVNKK